MENGKCALCGIDAPFKCTACKIVSYCGVEHQKKHWKIHKNDCRSFEICHSKEMGRHVVATRNIKAKSVIFMDAPLVVGPKWCLEEHEKDIPIFPCVGCFAPVQIGNAQCPKCSWPVCSPVCQGLENPQLHGLECAILCTGRGPENPTDHRTILDYYRSDSLFTLRCLLLHLKYPQKWKQLMDFESHSKERIGTKYYEEADVRIVSYLKSKFLDKIKDIEQTSGNKFLPDCDAKDLHELCGIMEVNSLNISLPNDQEICAIYPTACLLEHSCMPNCFYTFDIAKHFKISMIAARDIEKGEHLTIMHTHMLWGTQMRHEHLMTNKYFICKCERCVDPSELGTYISALKCIGADESSTCGGYLMSINPYSETIDWKCDQCPGTISNDQVIFLMSNIQDEVDELMMKKEATVQGLEDLINKLEQILHKNHYHLFGLKHSLIQLYGIQNGHMSEQLSDNILMRKIDLCNELLKTVDILDPYAIRLSLYTGIILYELHMATVEVEKRKLSLAKDEGKLYDYEELYNAERYLVRAKFILENNMDIPLGKKFVEAVVKASEKLELLFEQIKL